MFNTETKFENVVDFKFRNTYLLTKLTNFDNLNVKLVHNINDSWAAGFKLVTNFKSIYEKVKTRALCKVDADTLIGFELKYQEGILHKNFHLIRTLSDNLKTVIEFKLKQEDISAEFGLHKSFNEKQ